MTRENTKGDWREVSRDNPCPACGKPDWCGRASGGRTVRCMREGSPPAGMRFVKRDSDGGTLFRLDDPEVRTNRKLSRGTRSRTPRTTKQDQTDLASLMNSLRTALTDEHLARLAESTGIPTSAWAKLSPGWADKTSLRALGAGGAGWTEHPPDGAWVFPEHDGKGRLIGFSLRAADGRKGAPSSSLTGARRGLIVSADWHESDDPVLIVEGASDVAAACALGLAAIGRPSNRGGAEYLATMLEGRKVLVVGEHDAKAGGAWPGRDGARVTAGRLAAEWSEPVEWTLPPEPAKDIRAWLSAKVKAGLELSNAQAMQAAGRELLAALTTAAKPAKLSRPRIPDRIVELANELCRFGVSEEGEPFAVHRDGPAVARLFNESEALREALAYEYQQRFGTTPSRSALADAMAALAGMARTSEREPLAVRVARLTDQTGDDRVVIDLGNAAGRAIVVTGEGWRVVDRSPVLFRRSELTGRMPEPATQGDLEVLRQLLNVSDEAWPLLIAWMVAALIPEIPHPILMLGGEQGAGKSTAARMIAGLIDPSPALLGAEPRDPETWALTAAARWCPVIDNVSAIPRWFSDALCRTVTGEACTRRKLYSNRGLSLVSFRRAVIITSIDPGALRGDLAERMLLVDLEPITEVARRSETELLALYREEAPKLLGGLLDVLARTLAALPTVKPKSLGRMADFERVLAAVDAAAPELTGGRALELYAGQPERVAAEIVEGDPVATAIFELLETGEEWRGTATDLLDALSAIMRRKGGRLPKCWPDSPRGMAAALNRVMPALRRLGITHGKERLSDHKRTRMYTLRKVADSSVRTVRPSETPIDSSLTTSLDGPTAAPASDGSPKPTEQPSGQPSDVATREEAPEPAPKAKSDGSDGSDGLFAELTA